MNGNILRYNISGIQQEEGNPWKDLPYKAMWKCIKTDRWMWQSLIRVDRSKQNKFNICRQVQDREAWAVRMVCRVMDGGKVTIYTARLSAALRRLVDPK